MKTTLSVIKADVGSIGGQVKPSVRLKQTIKQFAGENGGKLLKDVYVTSTGNDVTMLMLHQLGIANPKIQGLARHAFMATMTAPEEILYGAGEELRENSHNVQRFGPLCEIDFDECGNEQFIFFVADKSAPGVYNLPLYLAFADPMHNAGLSMSSKMAKGFSFTIMDMSYSEGDRVIELNAPEELHDFAHLLHDNDRFVIESIRNRTTREVACVVSTTQRQSIAQPYAGENETDALVRAEGNFPACSVILSPFHIGHCVANARYHDPLMSAKLNSAIGFFDTPVFIRGTTFRIRGGKINGVTNILDDCFGEWLANNGSAEAQTDREQGIGSVAILRMNPEQCAGIEKMSELDRRFTLRGKLCGPDETLSKHKRICRFCRGDGCWACWQSGTEVRQWDAY